MTDRFAELAPRLNSPEPGIRRIAIHDLIALNDARADDLLTDHLKGEGDEKAALLTIRHLRASRHLPARPVLLALYNNPATPVRTAHAAILAHDDLSEG